MFEETNDDTMFCDGCGEEYKVTDLETCPDCFLVICEECAKDHTCEPEYIELEDDEDMDMLEE